MFSFEHLLEKAHRPRVNGFRGRKDGARISWQLFCFFSHACIKSLRIAITIHCSIQIFPLSLHRRPNWILNPVRKRRCIPHLNISFIYTPRVVSRLEIFSAPCFYFRCINHHPPVDCRVVYS